MSFHSRARAKIRNFVFHNLVEIVGITAALGVVIITFVWFELPVQVIVLTVFILTPIFEFVYFRVHDRDTHRLREADDKMFVFNEDLDLPPKAHRHRQHHRRTAHQ